MFFGDKPANPHNLPSLAALERLSAPEIGIRLLQIWKSDERLRTLPDFARSLANNAYANHEIDRAAPILMEGLAFLAREGHIVRDPAQSAEFYVLSRSGRSVKFGTESNPGIPRSLDSREILHPLIAGECIPEMERGSAYFAEAVFKAFRRVEIAVKKASGIDDVVGVQLMRKAFGANGPLSEQGFEEAEVTALAHLFAGAIGRFKNPGSHRDVEESDVRVAMQLLAFASFLLTHLDRLPKRDKGSDVGPG